MVRIVIPDDYPPVISDTPALARLRELPDSEVEVWDSRPPGEEGLMARIAGAHTVVNILTTSRFTRHVLEHTRGLRHIAVWGPSVDNIDLDSAKRMSVTVTYTPGTASVAVAEHALALLMTLARKVPEMDARVRKGDWPRRRLTQLAGKTLGVLGTGAVGRYLSEIARGIGMNVVAWSYHPDAAWAARAGVRYAEFEWVLRNCDALSLHLRLSPETRRIVGADELAQMNPSALLINTARGALVDEDALVAALRDGTIAGAALDTFVREPLPPGHPLRTLSNVVLSPHIAGSTPEALSAGLSMVVDNVVGYLQERVEHRVV